ncbi:MAG TPA: amidohydrolase [Nocardioides bacterium]|uniref:amidohydrolase family protein n=1 Tax=uncultured Nocardioides sp. TaxID=198441 RepID=UPI000EBA7692|nr:amidohydrolase family protein [uncultured Nocardioides sp.]HCB05470.1 amidohydrolase [Nocardioides sp.]
MTLVTLLRDVETHAGRVDVLLRGDRIATTGRGLAVPPGAGLVEGAGRRLLPGLHDHHLHLLALAAARGSVACGPPAVTDVERLAAALRGAPGDGWVRGVGYHDEVAGPLDRVVLDRLIPDRPARIQHRSGALWMLNSRALAEVSDVLDDSADVERDANGEPLGRLWRYDDRLRAALPTPPPDLGSLGADLAAYGITGVTDATPMLDEGALAALSRGDLPQRVIVLGAALGAELPRGLEAGPFKLLLRDHDLPGRDELADAVAAAHAAHRPVAVHCVTLDALVLTLDVLETVGIMPGDRIEHAAICPQPFVADLARLGLRLVTQPDFLRTRGDTYLREVDAWELPDLYPYARLVAGGVPVCASSDAPFGDLDPWQALVTARDRTTRSGAVLGEDERVPVSVALDGYLSAPLDPGGPPRRIEAGAPADLVLLAAPLRDVLADPAAAAVVGTWIGGKRVYASV